MKDNNIAINDKYLLTIIEASQYFNIGENKLRNLAVANHNASWFMKSGNRILIKRKQFEKYLDNLAEV